jgi:hypothetical protein
MSATHKAVPAKPVQWETMSLRATAFYVGPLDVGPIRWWEELAGQASESKTVRAGVGQLVEQGTLGNRVLQLQIQPGRIDWLLLPKEDPESAGFSVLGDFGESKDYFSSLVSPWLGKGPRLVRLAFGAQLVIPTPNVEVAMRIMSEALPHLDLKDAGARDLVFQINHPAAHTNALVTKTGFGLAIRSTFRGITKYVFGCANFTGVGGIDRLSRRKNLVIQPITPPKVGKSF